MSALLFEKIAYLARRPSGHEDLLWSFELIPARKDLNLLVRTCCGKRAESLPFEVVESMDVAVLERILVRMEAEVLELHRKAHEDQGAKVALLSKITGQFMTIKSDENGNPTSYEVSQEELDRILGRKAHGEDQP